MIVQDFLVVLFFGVVHVVCAVLQGVHLDANIVDRNILGLLHHHPLQTLKRFQRHKLVQLFQILFDFLMGRSVVQGHINMSELVCDLVDLR